MTYYYEAQIPQDPEKWTFSWGARVVCVSGMLDGWRQWGSRSGLLHSSVCF